MNMMMEFDFQRVEINDWRSIWVNSPSMILANCNASVLIFVEIEKKQKWIHYLNETSNASAW